MGRRFFIPKCTPSCVFVIKCESDKELENLSFTHLHYWRTSARGSKPRKGIWEIVDSVQEIKVSEWQLCTRPTGQSVQIVTQIGRFPRQRSPRRKEILRWYGTTELLKRSTVQGRKKFN